MTENTTADGTNALTALAALNVRRAASILTANIGSSEPTRAYCGDCKGKGFDCTAVHGKRSARRCQRCRGKGFTTVGSTKR